MPLGISDVNPSMLPAKQHWESEADVARYVYKCMEALGLDTWHFEWEKTIRRMGCCKYAPRAVLLSIYYVRKYLALDQEQIRRTVLHELAHALAWDYNQTAGHDSTWHAFCLALGIGGEKSRSRVENFAPKEHPTQRVRYVMYHLETGEVFEGFARYPSRTAKHIGQVYIKGRKKETLGKLGIRALDGEDPKEI